MCCEKTWSDQTSVFFNLHIALIFSTCRSAGWKSICFCEWESTKLTELQIIVFWFCNQKNSAAWNELWKCKRPRPSLCLQIELSCCYRLSHFSSLVCKNVLQFRLPLARDYDAQVLWENRISYQVRNNAGRCQTGFFQSSLYTIPFKSHPQI